MPFLFCFVYARLPFFRNFLWREKEMYSPNCCRKKWRSTFAVGMLQALRWILAFIYQKLYDNPSTQFAPIAS